MLYEVTSSALILYRLICMFPNPKITCLGAAGYKVPWEMFFKHKETGIHTAPMKSDGTYDFEMLDRLYLDSQDMTKWEMTDMLGNKFNRLVLYRAD